MVVIKKLGILSVAKVQALMMAIFGLFLGIFYAIVFGLIGVANQAGEGVVSGGIVAGLGIGAVVVAPIFYGIIGFISGAIGAGVYNLIAGWIGGIEMEFVETVVIKK